MFENDFENSFSGGFGNSQAPPTEKKSQNKLSRIAPVSISSIQDLLPGQDQLRIGVESFTCVSIVGIVRNVNRSGISIFYDIDDMTGPPLTVRYYSGDTEEEPAAMENTYVKVYGSLRAFDNKQSLMVFRIMPLEDLNELTVHLLEIIQCRIVLQKDVIRVVENKSAGGAITYGAAMDMGQKNSKTNAINVGSAVVAPAKFGSKSSGVNQIYEFLKQNQSDEGLSVDELKHHFSSFTEHQVTSFLDILCGEGHVYTTIDDVHFKVTE